MEQKVKSIAASLKGYKHQKLDIPSRKYIHEGLVDLNGQERYCFLFSDIILYCSMKKKIGTIEELPGTVTSGIHRKERRKLSPRGALSSVANSSDASNPPDESSPCYYFKGSIPLNCCLVRDYPVSTNNSENASTNSDDNAKFQILRGDTKNLYTFQCSSEMEKLEWMEKVEQAIQAEMKKLEKRKRKKEKKKFKPHSSDIPLLHLQTGSVRVVSKSTKRRSAGAVSSTTREKVGGGEEFAARALTSVFPPRKKTVDANSALDAGQREQRRTFLFTQLVSTEQTYREDLSTVVECYLKPLRSEHVPTPSTLSSIASALTSAITDVVVESDGYSLTKKATSTREEPEPLNDQEEILPTDEIPAIFGNIELILSVHSELITKLKSCLPKEAVIQVERHRGITHQRSRSIIPPEVHDSVGDLFLEMAHQFAVSYEVYCDGYRRSMDALKRCKEQHPKFARFLQQQAQTNPECNLLKLEDFLIKPIQRICRYPLMFKEIVEVTDSSHSTYKTLLSCVEKYERIADRINSSREASENLSKLIQLENSIVVGSSKRKFAVPGRIFLYQGELQKISPRGDKPQPRMCILFNDMLVYAAMLRPSEVNSSGSPGANTGGKTLHYKGEIPISEAKIGEPIHEKSNKNALLYGFTVTRKDTGRVYIFYAASQFEKDIWMMKLQLAADSRLDDKRAGKTTTPRSSPSASPVTKSPLLEKGNVVPPLMLSTSQPVLIKKTKEKEKEQGKEKEKEKKAKEKKEKEKEKEKDEKEKEKEKKRKSLSARAKIREPKLNRPQCKHGIFCKSADPQHWLEYQHTGVVSPDKPKPKKVVEKKEPITQPTPPKIRQKVLSQQQLEVQLEERVRKEELERLSIIVTRIEEEREAMKVEMEKERKLKRRAEARVRRLEKMLEIRGVKVPEWNEQDEEEEEEFSSVKEEQKHDDAKGQPAENKEELKQEEEEAMMLAKVEEARKRKEEEARLWKERMRREKEEEERAWARVAAQIETEQGETDAEKKLDPKALLKVASAEDLLKVFCDEVTGELLRTRSSTAPATPTKPPSSFPLVFFGDASTTD